MKDILSFQGWNKVIIDDLISHASKIKKAPEKYFDILKNKTMLMIFEKPSLRTRLSFEAGMTQMGGHAIYLDVKDSPLSEKESIEDTAKVSSRYCDIIMARMFEQESIEKLAKNSEVPVINGLTNTFHPCQILSDLFTIYETLENSDSLNFRRAQKPSKNSLSVFDKKEKLKGLKLCFVGDGNNNITHSLLEGCSIMGMDISVGCPKQHSPQPWIANMAKNNAKKSGSKITITEDAKKAVENADIVYTDSWMSYHVPKGQKEERIKIFQPFQANKGLMKHAKKDAIFMNCLPAMRGYEQTAEVIDGKQSIVFDQAENRLHMQKAVILKLLNKI